ncbi:PP2C family protein-serine/threonine phosphatase [Roseivivax isoporae]|uniref:Protein phosphatase n=1 Tax=Roseivivax isoporae LMG 25204 TaxID=1449351 RepID=X7F3R7_9RHOB|nr:protein phosphatase 2C domain-containing protein [Roseivivax isoporae]ETX26751.1 protein phosphatase [Roseivivax isoporae LMG 25204]
MSTPVTRSPLLRPQQAPRFFGAGLTHAGRVREENEDSILTDPDGVLWAVADGMGGYGHGALAADIVIDEVSRVGAQALPSAALRAALERANAQILMRARQDRTGPMGATTVAMMIQGSVAHVAWAGDCRAYLMRGGQLRLLTRDHSVVQEMVDEGLLSDSDRNRHPQSHVVTRAVGYEPQLEVDTTATPLVHGDRMILCSDGLTACLGEHDIAGITRTAQDPRHLCTLLVTAALNDGAPDNVSVIGVFASEA